MVAAQAGVPQLGASSLKAALDADWDDPAARDEALARVLGLLSQVEAFAASQDGDAAAAVACHLKRGRTQRIHPSRRGPAGPTAPPPAHPGPTRQAAPT